jgi:hypothetical protein
MHDHRESHPPLLSGHPQPQHASSSCLHIRARHLHWRWLGKLSRQSPVHFRLCNVPGRHPLLMVLGALSSPVRVLRQSITSYFINCFWSCTSHCGELPSFTATSVQSTSPAINAQSMLRLISTSSMSGSPLEIFASSTSRGLPNSPTSSRRECSWSSSPTSTSVVARVSTVWGVNYVFIYFSVYELYRPWASYVVLPYICNMYTINNWSIVFHFYQILLRSD